MPCAAQIAASATAAVSVRSRDEASPTGRNPLSARYLSSSTENPDEGPTAPAIAASDGEPGSSAVVLSNSGTNRPLTEDLMLQGFDAVRKRGGKPVNAVIHTYPNVSQFWKYDPKQFLASPVYSRDYPPAKNLE